MVKKQSKKRNVKRVKKTKRKLHTPKLKGKTKLHTPKLKGKTKLSTFNNNSNSNSKLKDMFIFKTINSTGTIGTNPEIRDVNYITCTIDYALDYTTNRTSYMFGKTQLDEANVEESSRKKIKLIEFSQETATKNVFISSFLFPEPEKRAYNALKKLMHPRTVPGFLHEIFVLYLINDLRLPDDTIIQLKDAWKGPCLRSKDLKKMAGDKNYNYLYDYFFERFNRLQRGDYTLEQYTTDIKEGGYYGPWGFRQIDKTKQEQDYGLLGKSHVKLHNYRILNGGGNY